ncbi:hypothetical protein MP638_000136 [Amoeboaphelidium occidentale]|nr:hypothetical protein MP638_000136 [Amoeboaphelidium occidentale]
MEDSDSSLFDLSSGQEDVDWENVDEIEEESDHSELDVNIEADENGEPLDLLRALSEAQSASSHNHNETSPWLKSEDADIELQNIVSYLSPCQRSRILRYDVISRFRECVQRKWGKQHSRSSIWADIFPFGSFEPMLYLPNGDIDLVVITNKRSSDISVLDSLYAIIKREFALNEQVNFIRGARVPIIKFTDRKTGINVDVCVRRITGITSTNWLMKYMSSRGERYASVAKGLILLLKILLANLNLNEPKDGGLASYGICVMVLVYLQHVDWSKISIDVKNLSGFLDFYSNGEFDYRHHVIRYDNRSDRFNINKKPVPNTNLVIIDPTDPTTNIGRSAYNYYSVYQGNSPLFYFTDFLAFKYVHEILQSCVNLKTHDCFSTLFYVDACTIELKSSLETLSVDETMMQPYPSYSQLSQLLKNAERKVKAKDFKGPPEDKPKTSGKIKKKKLKKAANKAKKQKRKKQFQK